MLDLSSLAAGDRVQHELVARGREEKTNKTGDLCAVLQLGTAAGAISANVWKEQLPWIEGVRAGSVVQVIGAVEHYQGRRQLKLTAPLRVIAAAAANLEQFLPRISIETPRLWEQVDKWRHEMRSARHSNARPVRLAATTRRSAGSCCTWSRSARSSVARRGRCTRTWTS